MSTMACPTQIPFAAADYFASAGVDVQAAHPRVAQVFFPGRGWVEVAHQYPLTRKLVAEFAGQGATDISVRCLNRTPDFRVAELIDDPHVVAVYSLMILAPRPDGWTRSMLSQRTRLPRHRVEVALGRLVKAGKAERTERGAWSRWFIPAAPAAKPMGLDRTQVLAELRDVTCMAEADALAAVEMADRFGEHGVTVERRDWVTEGDCCFYTVVEAWKWQIARWDDGSYELVLVQHFNPATV
jgi:hypothetical protein